MPEEVTYGHGAHSADIDDTLFHEGPDDTDTRNFYFLDRQTKIARWSAWLDQPTSVLHALETARDDSRRVLMAAMRNTAQYHTPGSRPVAYTDGNGNATSRMLGADEYKVGPRTPRGTPIDFHFDFRTAAEQDQVWRDALTAHNGAVYSSNGGASVYGAMVVANAANDGNRAGCAPALGRWWDGLSGGAKVGVGIGGFLGFLLVTGGTTVGIGAGVGGWFKAESGETPSGSTVTITWESANPMAASTDMYLVTLALAGSDTKLQKSAPGTATSVVFDGVADGTYVVTVQFNMGTITTTEVVVKASPITANAIAPLPPTGVTVTAVASSATALPGVLVSWTAPSSTVTGYTVVVSSVDKNGKTDSLQPVEAGLLLSLFVPLTTAGSYIASVTASNARATSAPATIATTSAVAVDPTTPAPGVPRNVRFVAYRSTASGKPGFVVRWDPPTTGGWVVDYEVTVGSTATTTTVTDAVMVPFPDQADGAYSASVVARGVGTARGPAATATFTLAAASILPDSIDWGMYFSADEIAAFETKANGLDALDDKTFWGNVVKAVEDASGAYGGLASYQEQLVLARLLAAWLKLPVDPMPNVIDGYADELCTAAKFPKTSMGPANIAALSSELWKQAQTLRNSVTKTPIQRRYQVLAIARAISRYLGPGDGHRLYDFATLPFETVGITAANAGVTAQRYRFSCNGLVSGVWWYRVAGDTGPHTVNAWKGTTSLATATGNPSPVGWVYVGFATALAVQSGDELVFGVYHPQGTHARRPNGFTSSGITSMCLTSPQSSLAARNGLYGYASAGVTPGVAPTLCYDESEYYITPEFTAT